MLFMKSEPDAAATIIRTGTDDLAAAATAPIRETCPA